MVDTIDIVNGVYNERDNDGDVIGGTRIRTGMYVDYSRSIYKYNEQYDWIDGDVKLSKCTCLNSNGGNIMVRKHRNIAFANRD